MYEIPRKRILFYRRALIFCCCSATFSLTKYCYLVRNYMASVCMLCMSFEFSLNMHRFVRDKQALLKFFKNRVPESKIENELRCVDE